MSALTRTKCSCKFFPFISVFWSGSSPPFLQSCRVYGSWVSHKGWVEKIFFFLRPVPFQKGGCSLGWWCSSLLLSSAKATCILFQPVWPWTQAGVSYIARCNWQTKWSALHFFQKHLLWGSQTEHNFNLYPAFPSLAKLGYAHEDKITWKIRTQFYCTDFNRMHGLNQLLKGKNLLYGLLYVLRRSWRKTSARKYRKFGIFGANRECRSSLF